MITKEVRDSLKFELLTKGLESANIFNRIPNMNSFITNLLVSQALCSTDDFAELGFAEGMNVIYEVRAELHDKYGFRYSISE